MKRWLPLLSLALGLAYFGSKLLPARNAGPFDLVGFGRLPVLANGRIKPMDTLARSSLLQLQHRQAVTLPDGTELAADEWLLDVFFRPDKAETYPTFVVDNPDLLSLFNLRPDDSPVRDDKRRFAYRQLEPHLSDLEEQAKLADPVDASARTSFQRAVLQLYGDLVLFRSLEHTLAVPGSDDFLGELLKLQQNLQAGVAAVRAKQAGQPHDEDLAQSMLALAQRYDALAQSTNILAIPPEDGTPDALAWTTAGQALIGSFQSGQVDPSVLAYAGLGFAWRNQRPDQFNQLVSLYRKDLSKRYAPQLAKCDAESRFNTAEPFYASMVVYALAGFLALVSWLKWPEALGRSAFVLVALSWVVATAGIATRMWIEGRPPVTNLYSSALFIGWGAVALCIVLEWLYRNAIGSMAAGAIGFCTLQIAHVLSFSGDTMEMMRAVLDSNFWLATHVVVVTTGYASTFLAGFLALIYIFRGLFTRSLDKATADSLTRMVYAIVCFATLFSFVGTVLGGIWADQSWGRFWGWDPKENGALIIVLWNALILHARWGGLVRARGLMCLAVFGNVVTSWSWFGVNMLGVGLHSYGFTEAAFWWLTAFVLSQLAVIALANLPLSRWRSFRSA
jgi:ABC-type transport system involved in cytochrome c biogenesis permease subunit